MCVPKRQASGGSYEPLVSDLETNASCRPACQSKKRNLHTLWCKKFWNSSIVNGCCSTVLRVGSLFSQVSARCSHCPSRTTLPPLNQVLIPSRLISLQPSPPSTRPGPGPKLSSAGGESAGARGRGDTHRVVEDLQVARALGDIPAPAHKVLEEVVVHVGDRRGVRLSRIRG